nr:sensor histidine kinase [Terrimonas ginsenosidimutans]
MSQQIGTFNLNRIPDKDTLLAGWKMYAGDDPQFANATFDDSKWEPADPYLQKDIQEFDQLRRSGIIWLRLHVNAASTTLKQQLSAYIIQYTASAVFLNGSLIKKYGTISNDPNDVKAWLPSPMPFPIHFDPGGKNVIAVRIAYEPGMPHISLMNGALTAFEMRIGELNKATENYLANQWQSKIYIIIYGVSAGILMIAGIIYLVYFLYDKRQKVHLYYAISVLALSLNAFPIEVWGADRYGPVAIACWVYYFEAIFFMIGTLFILITIYTIFNYPYRKTFAMLSAIALVLCVLMYTHGTPAFFWASNKYPVVCLLNGVYVCWWAMQKHKKDARIILIGLIIYLGFTVIANIADIDSLSNQLAFYIGQMAFPVGMSFYLGLQSSAINKRLSSTLEEVQELSAKNLLQEKEKQQLLAAQNEILEVQVRERTAALNQSLEDLKATQSHLIQSEKMASLGELTAGIAHEIQNPLNFVNNFSEVTNELVDEMYLELNKGEIMEAKALAIDIKENLDKISHHGKRAEAIVKGMLQYSRRSTGEKEATDINQMCDEYIRLAYHNYLGKPGNSHCFLKTKFDTSIKTIDVIPEDFGMVIMNLLNNAFHAVNQTANGTPPGYEPTVSIATKKLQGKIEIEISDNGTGIPENIIEKIFQPFFTTKPAGQGTGLGLSLSYDIVKAHGGGLKVSSTHGKGSVFTIQLPSTK